MPATAPLPMISVASPHPAGPTSEPRAGSGDSARVFDSHLDAARQQQSGSNAPAATPAPSDHPDANSKQASKDTNGQAAATDGSGTPADEAAKGTSAVTASLASGAKAVAASGAGDPSAPSDKPAAHGEDSSTPDASSVAGAMLALLGQAMPANASAATGGAAKVMAASILKASLGGSPAADPLTPGGSDPAAATTTDGSATAGTTPAAGGAVPGPQGLAAFNDLFAAGLPKSAARQDDKASVDALAGLMQATAQVTAAPQAVAPHALTITSQVGSSDFAQQLGQQVAWLGGQDIKQARIKLHPEELGSLDVKVSVQHTGQVDVSFAAQHPATVHALQQTLPQLDALLAQQGLSLGQAHVGQQSAGGGDTGRQSSSSGMAGDPTDAAIGEVGAAPATISAIGLLDAFA
ncbi:MAG: hypothetical protein B7X39_12225 [Lysobacterales bacterium 14-68-21]|nr:MAG: hypothetical protein B7X45_09970 [Xanthomonadales bacterium 15-68-25]OZB65670.1 MAG: hypothetical protein B7X39_12225 [Xanthomonadales bacterium 14-68-21]